ncbi:hypothetical protein [Lysinibacillus telephonicus]|uniref:Uncharacterized protein n=1 Tax=Lysinibacillus telephonicus TaxID=1714840 RepID=A0A431UXE2_9BACI|nr:hypothetical protein [Lysinibacillus telephonicus]RTQ96105.1 hypothetical protein EKG35_01685 [Lysinibacillus telephonicus]
MKLQINLLAYTIAAFLIFAVINSFSFTTYANEDHHKFKDEYEKLDIKTKQQVDDILSSLKEDLTALGVEVPKHKGKHNGFENLDDKTKEKAENIIKELKDGKLTKEEANKKLKELGVTLPEKHGKCSVFENLDSKTKEKAKKIFKQMKDGSISKEEGKKQLAKLGIEIPKHPMHESYDKLDDEAKAKVKSRIEEAKSEFEKIGVTFPKKYEYFLK